MDEPGRGPINYKGLISQPSRHIGLATCKFEIEATMAYESEGIKLRFRPTFLHGPNFPARLTKEPVPNIIKDVDSYTPKLSEYLLARAYYNSTRAPHDQDAPKGKLVPLFHKELKPSDVGKLNRLVIPKKLALKYLPKIPSAENNGYNNVDELELVFYDRYMMSWNLRYCYWKSSRSFVFTTGWNSFAKGMRLRANDRVIFSTYECDGRKIFIINVEYCDEGTMDGEIVKELETKMDVDEREVTRKNEVESKKNEVGSIGIEERKGMRLFGFQIQV